MKATSASGVWLLAGLLATGTAVADDGAFLDPPYEYQAYPIDTDGPLDPQLSLDSDKGLFSVTPRPILTNSTSPAHSDVESVISYQTAVKSQSARGTCSFFSVTAVLEAALIRYKGLSHDLNLSEQWLSYLIERLKSEDGSFSENNINALAYYGTVETSLMPYEGDVWKSAHDSALAQKRCGSVPAPYLTGCLVSHRDPRMLTEADDSLRARDPQFFAIRGRARQFRAQYLAPTLDWHAHNYEIKTTGEIKAALAQGTPVTLDVNFYFGAWNYRLADEYGIPRDTTQWFKGVIGYPEPGSIDRAKSPAHPAGHSVEIVGYDDDLVVQTHVQMTNGAWRDFSYKGVYFIKNSWGTGSFGANFKINGVAHPGYGMITQKYAHEQGSFHRLPVY